VTESRALPLTPAVWLGIGLGGFVDGIVLHQILQWHHMLTSAGYPPDSVSNLNVNTLYDGIFHAVAWAATAIGLVLLHRAVRRGVVRWSGRRLLGGLAMGWGGFNVVEGILSHHVLGLHHVREAAANPLLWDIGFLVFGAALLVGGYAAARSERRPAREALRRAA
jgi:uncharacterized membrane protein